MTKPIRVRSYAQSPSDVQYGCDALIAYLLPREPKLDGVIMPISMTHVAPRWMRSLTQFARQSAQQLLNVQSRRQGFDDLMWALSPKWEERLGLAGIDPGTMLVVNHERWNRAYWQLSTTYRFYADLQRKLNATGFEAPIAERKITKTFKVKPKPQGDAALVHSRITVDSSDEQEGYGAQLVRRLNRKIIS